MKQTLEKTKQMLKKKERIGLTILDDSMQIFYSLYKYRLDEYFMMQANIPSLTSIEMWNFHLVPSPETKHVLTELKLYANIQSYHFNIKLSVNCEKTGAQIVHFMKSIQINSNHLISKL